MAESEASTECSSPRQYTEEETDQQLLQWAGRLELESIDLREKSSDLLKALEANSRKLQESYDKINTASGWLKNVKEVRDQLVKVENAQKNNEAKIMTLEKRVEESGLQTRSSVETHSAQIAKTVENAQDLVLNLGRQSENMLAIMQSLSSETQLVTQRQVGLEQQVRQLREGMVAWKEELSDHVTNTVRGAIEAATSMPITVRSHKQIQHTDLRVTKPMSPASSREHTRKLRTQTSSAMRWIIPWEEITENDHLLSSEL
ncbi:LAQU0S17e01530g1_1 [Lachancea quebecensis]|uniref:LAQU0S17e01530g1_1 n=1 Tax=Lachancea quebecensis TaxID=1654605 RepID=A0A0P1KW86_9SACH|nr:LAQU0S17e01530g1_1 [Lachancea quebecensis]